MSDTRTPAIDIALLGDATGVRAPAVAAPAAAASRAARGARVDLRGEILAGYGPVFLHGLWMTIQLTIVSIGAGLLLGASGASTAPLLACMACQALAAVLCFVKPTGPAGRATHNFTKRTQPPHARR